MKKERQSIKRVLSMIMVIAMVLTMMPAVVFAAETPTKLYLTPNSNWLIDNARFAAYFFGNGDTWVSMTDSDGDGMYEVEVPSGYPNVIFCRMNPSDTTNSWDTKWNQSADLTVPTDGTNWYTVAEGAWDKGDGAWSTYTPPAEPEPEEPSENVKYEVTFHFADTLGWGSVNLYTWTGSSTTHTGAWPGSPVSQDADGFYTMTFTYEAPANQDLNFIFSNGGSSQTVDLALTASDFVDNKAEKWIELTTANDEGKYNANILDSGDAIAIPCTVNGTSVTFQYKDDTATGVCVAGTFNDWNETANALTKNEHGVWSTTITLEPGVYEYKFLVNGNYLDGANSSFTILDPNAVDNNEIIINVHYTRTDADYTGWNVYAWGAEGLKDQYDFADVNDEKVAIITLDGRANTSVSFKVRQRVGVNDWYAQGGDTTVDLSKIVSGTIDVHISYDGKNYTVTQKQNADIVLANKLTDVQLDYTNNKIEVQAAQAIAAPATELTLVKIEGEDVKEITAEVTTSGSTYVLTPSVTLDLVTLYQYKVKYDGYTYDIGIDNVYATKKFADAYTYTGNDLGATWRQNYTTFKVWAPTASAVSVNLYTTGSDSEEGAKFFRTVQMVKSASGTWYVNLNGDLNGFYYTYAVTVNGETVEAVDPYARTTGVNGNRGMVVDLDSTDPEGWADDKNPNPITSYTDAVIYELHVRDFSIDDSSGVTEANRGKYLAFTEEGTKTANGVTTGIDYLDELGVTHVHLLPVYDYGSVDETTCDTFNWGYDPQNYNTPEGSYSTDPYNGEVRVNEFKQMVMSLHEHDISVIMDVVYNHVYNAEKFCFNNIVPGYFSRVNSNASGCGNDTASEREMVRKYIVESVLYWHQEYHIDGFRFDLVGLLDVDTINQIVKEVHACCDDVIFYGEGWDMDGTNKEPNTEMAKQGNADKTPGFGYFSDSMRNQVGGSNGSSLGFVSGSTGGESALVNYYLAQPESWGKTWTTNPQQVIQYASCHDNYTLIDKLVLSTGATGITNDIISMNNLAAAVYMTAQGVPFIHAGEEFLREKLEEDGGRCENSYNASDYVNHIEWSNLEKDIYVDNVEYYKGLIAFRAKHPALRYDTAEKISANIQSVIPDSNVVAFLIDGSGVEEETDDICVIFNANAASKVVSLPEGIWNVCIDGDTAGTETLYTAETAVQVEGISAMVLTKADEGKNTGDVAAADENKYQVVTYNEYPASSEEGKITVYFSNNKKWDAVYAYAWNDDDVVAAWPGTVMETYTQNTYGETICAITLPADVTSIIFSDGGSEQTIDINSIVNGQGYYCTNKGGTSSFINNGKYEGDTQYYLFGWINGENYGCEENINAMGKYVFDASGELTVTFEQDSYVGVKTTGNGAWYMTDGWLGNVTGTWLYNSKNLDETANKLMVPGGVEVTFTLDYDDSDDIVNLVYSAAVSETSYSALDTSGIQDGVTLHCWNWSFAEIEANMAAIAEQGYTAIQTSPVQPLKEATTSSTVVSHWWVYYQPVDFEITDEEGNALGTKAELESMIKTAHNYGIKVIVDVVANHLANNEGNDLSDKIPTEISGNSAYWHDIKTNITDWNDRYDMTQNCLTGLPDLNTANQDIQDMVLAFLKECIDIGVDGFRFDMAKSIETPEDDISFASDFWPTVIGGAEGYAQEKGKDIYCYGEVLDEAKIAISAYTEYMAVTDNSWGNTLRENISSGTASIVEGYNKAADANQLVVWAESHDTYTTEETAQNSAGVSVENINKTWALVAARADAMGLYLARPESTEQLLGVASKTGWADEAVKAVNNFHNAFIGEMEAVGAEDDIIYVERGNSGIVLVNAAGTTANVEIMVSWMDVGTYTDQITGNTFTVTCDEEGNKRISGEIGETGIAVVYDAATVEFSRVTLGNALDMDFAFPKSSQSDWTGAYIEIIKAFADDKDRGDDGKLTVEFADWNSEVIDGEKYWYVTFPDISAKEMADDITITVYNAAGEAIGDSFVDSIRSYVMRILEDHDDKTKTMLVDMLNYGAAAQEYYGYGTDDLANSQLTDAQKAYASKTMAVCNDTHSKGEHYNGSRLELKNSINLQMAFEGLTTDMTAKVVYTNHRDELVSEEVNAVEAAGTVVIDIDQIVVADGRQDITVTVYDENDAEYSKVTDSIESYVARRMKKAEGAEKALYEAVMKFSDSAYAYLHE